jgi:hypothetical protein
MKSRQRGSLAYRAEDALKTELTKTIGARAEDALKMELTKTIGARTVSAVIVEITCKAAWGAFNGVHTRARTHSRSRFERRTEEARSTYAKYGA